MKQWLETREVLDRLALLGREGKRAALATVVRVRGSAYRHEGAKLLVAADGSATGNVSGGCLEQDVREVALQVIASGTPQLRSYCSGVEEIAAWPVFTDVLLPPPELVLCGAGDDAQPLARCAADVGLRVIVVDRRPAWLTAERFPAAARLVTSDPADLARRLTLDAACY